VTRIKVTDQVNRIESVTVTLVNLDDDEVSQFNIDQLNSAVGFLETAAAELRAELKRCQIAFK
jgi:hypothetical protein